MSSKRERGLRYPVSFVAAELGVDRALLQRQLDGVGTDAGEGVTFREAYDVLSAKTERESDRDRRQKAEADSAEMDAELKRKTLMPVDTALGWVDEQGTFFRSKVMDRKDIGDAAKKALLNDAAEFKVPR